MNVKKIHVTPLNNGRVTVTATCKDIKGNNVIVQQQGVPLSRINLVIKQIEASENVNQYRTQMALSNWLT